MIFLGGLKRISDRTRQPRIEIMVNADGKAINTIW
jgi:hypothetical protein